MQPHTLSKAFDRRQWRRAPHSSIQQQLLFLSTYGAFFTSTFTPNFLSFNEHQIHGHRFGLLSETKDSQSLTISFHHRRKGPNHPGIDSLVPSNERFDRLRSYPYYHLIDTRPIRTHQYTTNLHKTLKKSSLLCAMKIAASRITFWCLT